MRRMSLDLGELAAGGVRPTVRPRSGVPVFDRLAGLPGRRQIGTAEVTADGVVTVEVPDDEAAWCFGDIGYEFSFHGTPPNAG